MYIYINSKFKNGFLLFMSRPLHYVGWSDVAFSKTGTMLPIRFVLKSQIKKYWSIWPRGRQSFNFLKIIGTLKIQFFSENLLQRTIAKK